MQHSSWVAIMIGSTVGGAVPMLWGGDLFSTLIFGSIGALAAVWFVYKFR